MATRTVFNPTKTFLSEALQNGVVTVTFTKTDGSERVMKCTLQESYLKPYEKKTERERVVNDNVISVWDVDNSGWRSFKYDSLISVVI